MNRFRFIASLCICLQLTTTLSAASIPSAKTTRRIGILRIDGKAEPDAAQYPLLEQRLRNWLENDPRLGLEVTPVNATLSDLEIERHQKRERLSALVAQASDGGGDARWRRQVSVLADELTAAGTAGPEVLAALLALAIDDFRNGQTDAADRRLKAAARLAPEGKLQTFIPWEWESEPGEWMEMVRKAEQAETRSCAVSLQIGPSGAAVLLNGFPLGERRSFSAVPGASYQIEISAAGFETATRTFACRSAGSNVVTVALNLSSKPGIPDPARLRQLSEAHGIQSLVVVEPQADRYRLFLYTPGVALDELPLRAPLTAHSLRDSEGLPIASEKFSELVDKHQLAPFRLAATDSSISRSDAPAPWALALREESGGSSSRWYNSGTFWAIAGSIAVGAVVAYLATRGHSPQTQGGVSYRINPGN